ncbi:MAG: dethiobiotin synthase [Candidatus Margulisiibacteriota bacterium]
MPGVFITATDTGVGKTYITTLLAHTLQSLGVDVGVMKPFSAGPTAESDAVYLKAKLKLKDSLRQINPVSVKPPLAPYAANKKLKVKKVFKAYKQLEAKHDLVIVEGIGGALVPLTKNYFVADLIKDLKIPAIIVARAGLGTINHTLLTIEALKQRKIAIMGFILNGYTGKELSEKSNSRIIYKLTGVPILAKVKWQKTIKK